MVELTPGTPRENVAAILGAFLHYGEDDGKKGV